MGKKKTNEEFLEELKAKRSNDWKEYEFLGKYKSAHAKIRARHICGYTWAISPHSFLRGNGCPECSKKRVAKIRSKSNEAFLREIKTKRPSDWMEYEILEKYQGGHTKIKVRHCKCNRIYGITPNHFLQRVRCPYCSGRMKKSDKQFKKEVYKLVGGDYTVLNNYVNNKIKIKIRHEKCQNVWDVNPLHFIQGSRCPFCSGLMRKTNDQFQQEVKDLEGDNYTFLDTYINDSIKIKVRHNNCGHIYKVKPNSFLNGNRCPKCSKRNSHGSQMIHSYLMEYNIQYTVEQSFDDLKSDYGRKLRFDFSILKNNKLILLIEFDGRQHFEIIDQWGGEEEFFRRRLNDRAKNEYCKKNNIPLLRIKYTEKDKIEEILSTFLKDLMF